MLFGPYPGVITGVHDGDTVSIELDLGFGIHATDFRGRIFGINAPELSTPEGKAARDFLLEHLPVGSQVRVISHGWDKYGGRFDAEVRYGAPDFNSDVATLMLSSGHATPLAHASVAATPEQEVIADAVH